MLKEGVKRSPIVPTRKQKREMFGRGYKCTCGNKNIHLFSIRRTTPNQNSWTLTCFNCGRKHRHITMYSK